MLRIPIRVLSMTLVVTCGSLWQGPAAGQAAATDGDCEVVMEDEEIQDASGNPMVVQVPICKGWERRSDDQATGEGGCKRIEWRLKLVPNFSGGPAGTVRVPVCIQ